jgi:hypothetical protein
MKPRTLSLALAVLILSVPVLAADAPYAGQQGRTIKALSEDDIAALRKGEGMGMAKAAELNGYPGPAHVLQLAAQLGLTEAQQRDVQAIFDRMSAAAKRLGVELIATGAGGAHIHAGIAGAGSWPVANARYSS